MKKDVSVLNFIEFSPSLNSEDLRELIVKSADSVSEGRYLITVFDAPSDWNSRTSIESMIIDLTLGSVHSRQLSWEYYGNGAVRCYDPISKELTKTLQWNIVRRSGLKSYKKRASLGKKTLKSNELPVGHKVFTRDVANNVWHLIDEGHITRLIARFSNLLVWKDEEIRVYLSGNEIKNLDRTKLDLSGDLVGVPTKILYEWNSGSRLF